MCVCCPHDENGDDMDPSLSQLIYVAVPGDWLCVVLGMSAWMPISSNGIIVIARATEFTNRYS